MKRRCVICGRPFTPRNAPHKYCDECSPWKSRGRAKYDSETLAWLERRSAENMALFFHDELRAVQEGRPVHGNILRTLRTNALIKRCGPRRRRHGYMLTPLAENLLEELNENGN